MSLRNSLSVLGGWLLSVACGYSVPPPAAPLTASKPLCTPGISECLPNDVVHDWLSAPDLSVLGAAEAPRGIQKAQVLTLRTMARERVVFRAKWRAFSTTTQHNVPRREVAAYAVQRLYLTPEQYVVPPAAANCLDLDEYRANIDPEASPTFEGAKCVFGFLQYWLETAAPLDVANDKGWLEPVDGPLDQRLFRTNASYRQAVANLNLLTYLIDHDDSHPNQFLVTGGSAGLHIYSVDNSMSFTSGTNPNLSDTQDWSKIQVPALPDQEVQRLSDVSAADLERLLVLQQFELNNGRLVRVSPARYEGRSPDGIAWRNQRLNIGLSRQELSQLQQRLKALLGSIERGKILTFKSQARRAEPLLKQVRNTK